MSESQSALHQLLEGSKITVDDARAAVALLAATATGQPEAVYRHMAGGGVAIGTVTPLPNADHVRSLTERLERVETRLQETNEKLDKVLAALGAK